MCSRHYAADASTWQCLICPTHHTTPHHNPMICGMGAPSHHPAHWGAPTRLLLLTPTITQAQPHAIGSLHWGFCHIVGALTSPLPLPYCLPMGPFTSGSGWLASRRSVRRSPKQIILRAWGQGSEPSSTDGSWAGADPTSSLPDGMGRGEWRGEQGGGGKQRRQLERGGEGVPHAVRQWLAALGTAALRGLVKGQSAHGLSVVSSC